MLVNFVFFIVGLVLETLLFWRGVKANLWRYYPLFYAYIGYELVRTVVLFTIMQIRPEHYAMAFWLSQLGVLLLQILVAWEVFRQTFASVLFVRRAGSLLLSVIFVVLAATYFFRGDHSGSVFGRLEIETDLFISVFVATTIWLSRFYAIPLGRNIWGMALGLGMTVSATLVNQAVFEIAGTFLPYWQLIWPLTFMSSVALWTWALWSYAPNPKLSPDRIHGLQRLLVDWQYGWNQMRAALRKAVGL